MAVGAGGWQPGGIAGLDQLAARLQVTVERLSPEEEAALDQEPAAAHAETLRIPVVLTVEIPGELLDDA